MIVKTVQQENAKRLAFIQLMIVCCAFVSVIAIYQVSTKGLHKYSVHLQGHQERYGLYKT